MELEELLDDSSSYKTLPSENFQRAELPWTWPQLI